VFLTRKQAVVLALIFSVLVLTVDLAKAATPKQQPVVGYAHTTTCVYGNMPAQVHFVFTNRSTSRQTLIVWQYALTPGSPEPMKGPMATIDPVGSGLSPTAFPELWYWRLTLKPGETLTRTTFVTKVPEWGGPEPWDPAWGQRRFYYGATVNIKHTTVELYTSVSPTYC
jgi:hypothetical protein